MVRFVQITLLLASLLSLLLSMLLLQHRPQPIEWLVYTADDGETSAIYKMRPDGSEVTPLSPSNVEDAVPQWSIGGEWLLFERRTQDTASEIYIMRSDGSEVRNISDHSLPDTDATWSPDGQTIAYLSNRDGHPQVYQVQRDGTQRQNIGPSGDTWGVPYWSPKNDQIIYQHWLDGLIAHDLKTGETRELADLRRLGVTDGLAWAPHGRWFVTSSEVHGLIFRVNPHTGELTDISPPDLFVHMPSISPDGRWIALIAITAVEDRLILLKPDGSDVRTLAIFPHINQPQWSPDSQWVVFSALHEGNYDIFRLRIADVYLENLTNTPVDERDVQWSMSILLKPWHPHIWVMVTSLILIMLIGSKILPSA